MMIKKKYSVGAYVGFLLMVSGVAQADVAAKQMSALFKSSVFCGYTAFLSSQNPAAGVGWAGLFSFTTAGATAERLKKQEAFDAVVADAADYLATEGERESGLLASVKRIVRANSVEAGMTEVQAMSDREVVREILATIMETKDAPAERDEADLQSE